MWSDSTYLFFISGEAIDYLIKNTLTESAGARVGFPKVAIIITDGKSQDEVEIPARELRNIGVEVFSLGRSCLVKCFPFRTTLLLHAPKMKARFLKKDPSSRKESKVCCTL